MGKHKHKKEHMYIGREDNKNILSCVDFTRHHNFIRQSLQFSIGILTNGISFPISSSTTAFKQRETSLTGLEKYMDQIDTRRYGDYNITDIFCKDSTIQRATNMIVICESLFHGQHNQMTKILIPLRKYSSNIFHVNILRIITIIYHIYTECE